MSGISNPAFSSTRGGPSVGFGQALLQGLAPDGGLYVPDRVPVLPVPPPDARDLATIASWAAPSFVGESVRGERVLDEGAPADRRSASHHDVRRLCAAAFPFDTPLRELGSGLWLLELFHGPSLAFKDVGARFMARAMGALLAASPSEPDAPARTVLVATSGDTGGAVADAFHGVEGVRVVALFPAGGVSERQRHQMTTLGGNVTAVAVDGTFDDCQRLAKHAFADAELSRAAGLTSANSINIARLLPQSFYYLRAAAELGWEERPATYVVPSGNLGNLCAGLLAHRAGMPADGFVAATNTNHVFPDYLDTGAYEPRSSVPTLSNAMDVGAPSNLERIRWLYSEDVAAIRADVTGWWCDDDATRRAIAEAHDVSGVLLDPHTAVGWAAARALMAEGKLAPPVVVLATAHPAKFPEVVQEATGIEVPTPASLAAALAKSERIVFLGPGLSDLRNLLLDGPPDNPAAAPPTDGS